MEQFDIEPFVAFMKSRGLHRGLLGSDLRIAIRGHDTLTPCPIDSRSVVLLAQGHCPTPATSQVTLTPALSPSSFAKARRTGKGEGDARSKMEEPVV